MKLQNRYMFTDFDPGLDEDHIKGDSKKLAYLEYFEHFAGEAESSPMGKEHEPSHRIVQVCLYYFFECVGRPTWYLSPDIMWFLENVKMEIDIKDITIPKDILMVCFPYGYTVNGMALRNILIAHNKSNMMHDCIAELVNLKYQAISTHRFKGSIMVSTEIGDGRGAWDEKTTGRIAHKSSSSDNAAIGSILDYNHHSTEERHGAAQKKAIRLALAALVYAQAKPEVVVRERLSRKGKKIKMRGYDRYIKPIKYLPKSAIEYENQIESVKTGSKMRPHIRGWVLRHLKSDRFKRNEDGSIKTVLISPCLINAESIGEIDSLPDRSIVR